MAATLERQIYEAIRGQCISDASAERAAALAAELAVEKFTSTNTASAKLPADIKEKFQRWCNQQTSFPREFVQIVNEHFWDLI